MPAAWSCSNPAGIVASRLIRARSAQNPPVSRTSVAPIGRSAAVAPAVGTTAAMVVAVAADWAIARARG